MQIKLTTLIFSNINNNNNNNNNNNKDLYNSILPQLKSSQLRLSVNSNNSNSNSVNYAANNISYYDFGAFLVIIIIIIIICFYCYNIIS